MLPSPAEAAKPERQTMSSFHITYSPANDIWPNGFWGLYEINGDQIAERVIFKEIVIGKTTGAPHYRGGVIARHSWPGYVGGYGSLDEVMAEIDRRTPVTTCPPGRLSKP
jgi:hypothetical protein